MIRVTVECDGTKGIAENTDAVQLSEAVECFEGALRACGFCFKGSLDFVEEE